jgi:adenylyltransferase/sulfurtransferase
MQKARYSRQILFPGVGIEGQARLGRSHVLLVGCGGLGTVLAEILVRAGVGTLTIADRDYVDETNLQRQSLFTEQDWKSSLPKAVAATRRLREINSGVELVERVVDVNSTTVEPLMHSQDLVLDGTDNFETRYLLNDASLAWNIPWVYGACVGAYGLCLAFVPGRAPCLRCILEKMPPPGSSPTCDTSGVIGPVVHLVAALEAAEALKILTGNLQQLSRKLVTIDLWENRLLSLDLSNMEADPECPACGKRRFEFLAGEHESRTQSLCGRNAVQVWRAEPATVEFGPIAERLACHGKVTSNEYLLKASLGEVEIALFRDGRAIVRGIRDVEEAKRVYAKFIGV